MFSDLQVHECCIHKDWFCHPKRPSGIACCPLQVHECCIHKDWFCNPKRPSGTACCPFTFYSSVNNGLYINQCACMTKKN